MIRLLLALVLALWTGAAGAHPFLTRNLRVLHLAEEGGRLVVYYRLTLPLVVGAGIVPPAPDAPVPAAPYTIPSRESGAAFWYADIARIVADPAGLGARILAGHVLRDPDGAQLTGRLLSVAVHPKGYVPPFDDVPQARAATRPVPWPREVTRIDSGYVLVDAAIAYDLAPGVRRLSLASMLSPGALGEAGTVNLIVDHRAGGAVFYRIGGLLADPVVIAPSVWEGFASFVGGGIEHILEGADHLAFLICLVLGAGGLGALASRITGFTVGHSVTLAAGFFGVVPAGAWFAPSVEAAIAFSILLAALATLTGRGGPGLFLVTLSLGLVHGFGFSAALRDLLAADGPNVVPALAGFNVGVELGQLAVGLSVYAAFRFLRDGRADRPARLVAVGACMAVAAFWLIERVPVVWAAAVG